MKIARIVSGGQTGADVGGLDAAIHCDLPHGGFCPRGRRQEKGKVIPDKYQLTEMPSQDWEARIEANVVDSDATVVFCCGPPTGGSLLTVRLAEKHSQPCLAVDLDALTREESVEAVVEWLRSDCPDECVLNVAGSRESKVPGIGRAVEARLIDVVSKANGRLFYPIDDGRPPQYVREGGV